MLPLEGEFPDSREKGQTEKGRLKGLLQNRKRDVA